jgi:hypothetical protein
MENSSVTISVPFEALARSISQLDLTDKFKVLRLLDEQIAQAEEEMYEKDPIIQREIRDAREAYKAGNYEGIDQYLRKQKP